YSWAYYNTAQIYYELKRYDDAVIMLKKTIEKNPKDMEAYKLLCQILIKQEKIKEAKDIVVKFTEKNDNGDMYYIMSKLFEIDGDKISQLDTLELVFENQDTLTFDVDSIRMEYNELKKSK
ncbi:MAG: tetratricopeptide repeat protein, partial [Candidatus Gastranaerophilales bacterium]|nr:tetratricopeptide repeat protein [Candidatus Gastranaerophilales bacterium]